VLFGRRGDIARAEAAKLESAIGLAGDVTDPATPERVTAAAFAAFGQVDILVWNSGGPPLGAMVDQSLADVDGALDLLVRPFVRFTELVVPGMRDRKWGRVVAIGSSGVQQPIRNLALSNLARPAVAGICKTLSNEVSADGVTVNMVLPGRIATDRLQAHEKGRAEMEGVSRDEMRQRSQAAIPASRFGTPEEFGRVVAFLCGEPAAYITGSQIRVDGGVIASTH
jgi:3-oxoacyl-[acyl-carrier protein] reductase